jgi:hypothetical protein
VKSRKGIIRNAEELFNFCSKHLTIDNSKECEHKSVFFYVEEINRDVVTISTLKLLDFSLYCKDYDLSRILP